MGGAAKNWSLSGFFSPKTQHPSARVSLEGDDAAGKPIASFEYYRGDPIPGVTTDSGYSNYLLFNGKEVAHSNDALWWEIENETKRLEIAVEAGVAKLRCDGKELATAPVMSSGALASAQLRCQGVGGSGKLTDCRIVCY
jgi:hypothetical protein